jgi:hypothetical protein
VVLAGGVWAVLKLFVRPKGEGGGALPSGRVTVQTDHGGIAAAGNVSVRTSRGLSGLQAVLLVGILLGAMLLAGGLLGKRITATQGSVAIGGDAQDSPITIDAQGD